MTLVSKKIFSIKKIGSKTISDLIPNSDFRICDEFSSLTDILENLLSRFFISYLKEIPNLSFFAAPNEAAYDILKFSSYFPKKKSS